MRLSPHKVSRVCFHESCAYDCRRPNDPPAPRRGPRVGDAYLACEDLQAKDGGLYLLPVAAGAAGAEHFAKSHEPYIQDDDESYYLGQGKKAALAAKTDSLGIALLETQCTPTGGRWTARLPGTQWAVAMLAGLVRDQHKLHSAAKAVRLCPEAFILTSTAFSPRPRPSAPPLPQARSRPKPRTYVSQRGRAWRGRCASGIATHAP